MICLYAMYAMFLSFNVQYFPIKTTCNLLNQKIKEYCYFAKSRCLIGPFFTTNFLKKNFKSIIFNIFN